MKSKARRKIAAIIVALIALALIVTMLVIQPFNAPEDPRASMQDSTSSAENDSTDDVKSVGDDGPVGGSNPIRDDMDKVYDDMNLDGIKGVGDFSDEETGKIIKTAVRYSNHTLANTYFNSGKWYKEGRDMNEVYSYVEEFFTPQRNAEIRTIGPDGMLGRDLLPVMFFLAPDESQGIAGHPDCINDNTKECPANLEFSKVDYAASEDGDRRGMNVKFSTTMDLPLQVNGKDAISKITYHYDLTFIKNDAYENNESLMNEYVIDTYQTTIDFGQAEVQ